MFTNPFNANEELLNHTWHYSVQAQIILKCEEDKETEPMKFIIPYNFLSRHSFAYSMSKFKYFVSEHWKKRYPNFYSIEFFHEDLEPFNRELK